MACPGNTASLIPGPRAMSQAAPLLLWSKAELKGTDISMVSHCRAACKPKEAPQNPAETRVGVRGVVLAVYRGGSRRIWEAPVQTGLGGGVRSLSQGLEERGSGKNGLKRILLHNRHGKPGQGCSMLPALPKAPDRQPSTDFYMTKNKGAKSK